MLTPAPSKLIDVSQTSQIEQRSMSDYARLFAEAFPPRPAACPDDEMSWVRHVAQQATPKDRSWDWTTVHSIDGPLVSSLDSQERV